jgi:hypothetical protein
MFILCCESSPDSRFLYTDFGSCSDILEAWAAGARRRAFLTDVIGGRRSVEPGPGQPQAANLSLPRSIRKDGIFRHVTQTVRVTKIRLIQRVEELGAELETPSSPRVLISRRIENVVSGGHVEPALAAGKISESPRVILNKQTGGTCNELRVETFLMRVDKQKAPT